MNRRTWWSTVHDAAMAIGNMNVVTMTSQIEKPSTPTNQDRPIDSTHGCLETICRPAWPVSKFTSMATDAAKATTVDPRPTQRAASSEIERQRASTGNPTSGAAITRVSQGMRSIARSSPP